MHWQITMERSQVRMLQGLTALFASFSIDRGHSQHRGYMEEQGGCLHSTNRIRKEKVHRVRASIRQDIR